MKKIVVASLWVFLGLFFIFSAALAFINTYFPYFQVFEYVFSSVLTWAVVTTALSMSLIVFGFYIAGFYLKSGGAR